MLALNVHVLLPKKKRKDYFALTQIFIDISKFGICNVQPVSGSASQKALKDERSKDSILQF